MMATLTRSTSSPHYAVANERTYDVWGGVRDGSSTGDPNGRYCANLGHKQDDESGLIYMRVRYHEPGTGRFVSEDPARDGANWYVYCGNEPLGKVDWNGKVAGPHEYYYQVMAFFFGSGASKLSEDALRRSIHQAIRNFRIQVENNTANAIDKNLEATMAYAAGNKNVGDLLRGASARYKAWALMYGFGIAQLKMILQIMDL